MTAEGKASRPPEDKRCIPIDISAMDHGAIESEHVHQLYDEIAAHFSHTRYNPWPGVVKYIKAAEPYSTVLDVGCGNGKYLELRDDLLFIGVDRCVPLLELAKCTKRSDVLCCDCLSLPFAPETADLTLSIAVIHHLVCPDQRRAAVAEMLRCTKHGGLLVVYVWAREQKARSIGYRNFESGDLLVPWHVQEKYCKSKIATSTSSPDSSAVKVYRYYHVFTREEVEELGASFSGIADVESIDFEANNWILTLLKL